LWLSSITAKKVLSFKSLTITWRTLTPRPSSTLLSRSWVIGRGVVTFSSSRAMAFASKIPTQIGNAYACRTERSSVFKTGFFSNRFLLFGFAFELALIALMIYAPPFQALFEEGPLPFKYWGILFLYPPIMFLAEEGRKAVVRALDRRRAARLALAEAHPEPGGGT